MSSGLSWRKDLYTVIIPLLFDDSRIALKQGHDNGARMIFRILIVIACFFLSGVAAWSADQPPLAILYPADKSLVGNRMNLVLDPMTDWSTVPFVQAVVNNRTGYPVVDTSTGKHAVQGLELAPGLNLITVRILTQGVDEKTRKTSLRLIASREITVFNRDGDFAGAVPAGFTQALFHSREHEADCSGCHRLEVTQDDLAHRKPEEVLCFSCHQSIPSGKHIHGPVAVWNCLACHNPDIYPVKYQFTSRDPWKVSKTTQTVEPMLYTVSSAELFKPAAAALASREKAGDLLKDVLNYAKLNPGDKIRLEVHTDNTPPKTTKEKVKGKVKIIGFKTNQALTDARAKTLASMLKESGIKVKRITAVGMGDKLPKAPNTSKEGKELNNRVELIVHPADVKVKNSRKLPVLKDRDRVLVNLTYAQGPRITKLTVIEKVPKGRHYLTGSGSFKGKAKEPKVNGNELIWELGDMDANFTEALFSVVKKRKDAQPISDVVKVAYSVGSREMTREFDPKVPPKQSLTVKDVCLKCHAQVLSGIFKHGPAEAGYCNLCHDPHASSKRAWLIKSPWRLCTTCHTQHATGVHVVSGFADGGSHPTRKKPDPMRPGKQLSCASCHDPHSADSRELFTYNAKTRVEMCKLCHAKQYK